MFDTCNIVNVSEESKLTSTEIGNRLELFGFSHRTIYKSLDQLKPYNVIEVFKLEDISISICHTLKPKFYLYPELIMTFHLCQFASYYSFKKFIEDVFGEYADYILNKAEVIRLDFCIETNDFTYNQYQTNFRRKYTQKKSMKFYGKH